MADRLYLSLWFPAFDEDTMMPRLLAVLKQFPFSAASPGVETLTVHGVSFTEPELVEEVFDAGTPPESAVAIANQFLHADYAYQLQASWDLWVPVQEGALDPTWRTEPRRVTFLMHGVHFDDGLYQEQGHIQVDFDLDTPFLFEDVELTPLVESRVKENVAKLVAFTTAVEKNCGVSGRVLWSESDDNLAQKLLSRLQRVQ